MRVRPAGVARLYVLAAPLALLGCLNQEPLVTGGTGEASEGVVVVCSDFLSSAVSLLNADGDLVTAPVLIHSGSRPPALQTALSGDLALPTTPPPDGSILLVDRFPNATLTFVDPVSAQVTRQISVATGFASNPHDVLVRPDGRLLVTRNQPNGAPSRPDGLDLGDDVLVLTADGEPESRVGLSDPDGAPGRPDRILRVGDAYWVSLNRISRGWTDYRDGQIAVLKWSDEDSHLTIHRRISLGGMLNCSTLKEEAGVIAVTCSGAYSAAVGGFDTASSGIVLLNAQGDQLDLLSAADPRLDAVLSPSVVLGAGGAIYATQYGDTKGRPDRVVRWDRAAGTVAVVYEARSPWVLWSLSKAADGVPLLPDADRELPRLCRLSEAPTCINPCAATGLPPMAVAPYVRSL